MSLDHSLNVLNGCVVLYALSDLLAALVKSDNRKAKNLLADSQTASLCGIESREFDVLAVGVFHSMNMRHQSLAGNTAVAVEVYENGTLSL